MPYISISVRRRPRELDLSDLLLRGADRPLRSALDYYVHELTRLEMIEIFEGKRPTTPAFLRFKVSLDGVMIGMLPAATSSWLDMEYAPSMVCFHFSSPIKLLMRYA